MAVASPTLTAGTGSTLSGAMYMLEVEIITRAKLSARDVIASWAYDTPNRVAATHRANTELIIL